MSIIAAKCFERIIFVPLFIVLISVPVDRLILGIGLEVILTWLNIFKAKKCNRAFSYVRKICKLLFVVSPFISEISLPFCNVVLPAL